MREYISNRYTIVSELDKGGMASIFLANDSYSKKMVAIKILDKNKSKNVIDRKRFKSEIDLTTQVDSRYVVKILDYVINENIQYIVMDYIEGISLKKKIQERSNFNSDETINIMMDISQGLIAIHRAKIIHRDIKSLNILIDNSGKAVIIDLGISINNDSEDLTKTNNIIGSAHYLSPEIIQGHKAGEASDIYALGILMYEMLTGQYPYIHKDYQVVANHHVKSPLPSILKHNPNVRQSVLNIVTKATAKNVDDRYKNMRDMYEDVKTCLSDKRLHEKEWILNSDRPKKNLIYYFTNQWYIVAFFSLLIMIIMIIAILLVVLY